MNETCLDPILQIVRFTRAIEIIAAEQDGIERLARRILAHRGITEPHPSEVTDAKMAVSHARDLAHRGAMKVLSIGPTNRALIERRIAELGGIHLLEGMARARQKHAGNVLAFPPIDDPDGGVA
jgi:hypothetical protein